MSKELHALADAISRDRALDSKLRSQLLEQIVFVLEQLALEPQDRRRGLISPVFTAVSAALFPYTGLFLVWDKVKQKLIIEFELD